MIIWHHKRATRWILAGIGTLLTAQTSLYGANSVNAAYPIIGMRFEHRPVYRLSTGQLDALLASQATYLERNPVTIYANSFHDKLSPRQLGVAFDTPYAAASLRSTGRQGGVWQRIKTQDKALFGMQNQELGYPNIDTTIARTYFQRIAVQTLLPSRNASFAYSQGQVMIEADLPGSGIDIEAAVRALKYSDVRIDEPTVISLPLRAVPATIKHEELITLLPQVQKMSNAPLVLEAGSQSVTLSAEQVVAMVTIKKDPSDSSQSAPTIAFNESKLNAALDQLAEKVDQAPKPIDGLKPGDSGQAGIRVDGVHAKIQLVAALISRTTPNVPHAANTASTNNQESEPSKRNVVAIVTERLDPPALIKSTLPKPSSPAVSLSFDDGPNGTYTEPILNVLKQYGVHATFYVIGKNVQAYPAITKRILTEGHRLGNHSYTHSDLSKLNITLVEQELAKTQASVSTATGYLPVSFRPPYGSLNANVRQVAQKSGLSIEMWNVDPRDWAQPGANAITQRVLTGAGPGSSILLHVLYHQTVEALPGIITGLQKKGLTIQ